MNRRTAWPGATLALSLVLIGLFLLMVSCTSPGPTYIDARDIAPSAEALAPYTDAGIRMTAETEGAVQALLLELEVLLETIQEAAAREAGPSLTPNR